MSSLSHCRMAREEATTAALDVNGAEAAAGTKIENKDVGGWGLE